MPRDRLAEYYRKAGISDYGPTEWELDSIEILPMDNGLDEFFSEVAHLKKLVDILKAAVDNEKHLHSKILSCAGSDQTLTSELDDLINKIKSISQKIRSTLKEMSNSISGNTEDEKLSASLRIKSTQHSALLRVYMDIMNQHHQEQEKFRDFCKTRIKRQCEIAGYALSESEVDEMLEQGTFSGFTQQGILATEQAKQTLADVQARHDDILKLEKSLKELHGIFSEMAILVENQGVKIDLIETQVMNTQDYIHISVEQLNEAVRWNRKARRKKFIPFT